jgi:hypothetical protein
MHKQEVIEITIRLLSLHPPQKFKRRHFGTVEAMGLENTESSSPSMSSPPLQVSYKSKKLFKTY